MKKKILSAVLALIMCLSLIPVAVSAESSPSYLKDMIGTFEGTYVFSNEIAYGDTYQTGTATLTLNKNELSFEILTFFYHIQGDKKVADINIATKFKFDETGYNDWDAVTFVDGNPQYIEGGLNSDYKIGNLLNETKVEFIGKDASPVGKDCYKISVFGMMDFYFCDTQNGKTQKAVYNDTVFERTANDQIIVITSLIAGEATEPAKITSNSTEWSGWMIADDKVVIDGNIKLTGDTHLILTDDAELTVNGSIDAGSQYSSNKYMLNVYAQNAGTGAMTVNGRDGMEAGYIGSITVNGGNVNIFGCGGKPGIFTGWAVNVAGGVLNITGGENSSGVRSSTITVTGGELNIVGGNNTGNSYANYGMIDSGITVTGGVATITGGRKKDGQSYYAFEGDVAWIDATIFYNDTSSEKWKLFTDKDKIKYMTSLKLIPKGNSVFPYIDKNGDEQSAETKVISPKTNEWSGWMIVLVDTEINNIVKLIDDTNIILADGVELKVNGSIWDNGKVLNVYAQKSGTGKLTVCGSLGNALSGNVTFVGGTADITGGFGCAGYAIGTLTVTGTAKVNITAGAQSGLAKIGASGAENCTLIVSGNGELTAKGGTGEYEGGFGLNNFSATVTENGVVTAIGGDRSDIGSIYGSACGGEFGTLNATIETSSDGLIYSPFNNTLWSRLFLYVRLTEKKHTSNPYIDAEGNELTVQDAVEMTDFSSVWNSWMIAGGDIRIFSDVTLTGDTNLILADGADLSVGSIDCRGYLLTVYAQSSGANAGTLSVSGSVDSKYAADSFRMNYGVNGDITVNGGNVNITGGAKDTTAYPGVRGTVTVANGNVVITGGALDDACEAGVEGGVVVSGGKTVINGGEAALDYRFGLDKDGVPGIKPGIFNHSSVNVSGGELYVNGSGSACGIDSMEIDVTGGTVFINGGKKRGIAFGGDYDIIKATIETSFDGVTYLPYDPENRFDVRNKVVSLRLTAKAIENIDDKDNQTNPETGDTGNMPLWVILMTLSSMGFGICIALRKKKNDVKQ